LRITGIERGSLEDERQPVMQHRNNTTCRTQGLTLVEMVVAMSIMAIIITVLLPQLRAVQNNWDSQVCAGETLQNARVLIDHLNSNLSRAARITAVSDPGAANGYIEFLSNDANTLRYDINSANSYVEFGLVGSLSDLAGPVSKLQFTCYDANDLETPITDVASIRNVTFETTLTSSATLDADMTFTAQTYIRANTLPAGSISKLSEPWLEFDTNTGMEPALCRIDQNHYLCAYTGPGSDGWATVLVVDTATWAITNQTPLEFDTSQGLTPALSQIDSTHYLCAYAGPGNDGWATVLTVDTGTWTITNRTPFEFDTSQCLTPALSQIDSTHCLCAYTGFGNDGWATVLTIDTGAWTITNQTPFEFDTSQGLAPTLSQIDGTHYLCVYAGPGDDGWATVLTVDTGTWAITSQTPFEHDASQGLTPALSQIDSTHYLCVYQGETGIGWVVVLTVDTGSWTVTKETAFQFDSVMGQDPDLSQIDSTSFLCAYGGSAGQGVAVVLNVDPNDWSIGKETPLTFDGGQGDTPALCLIDSSHHLCSYTGPGGDGYAGAMELGEGILP